MCKHYQHLCRCMCLKYVTWNSQCKASSFKLQSNHARNGKMTALISWLRGHCESFVPRSANVFSDIFWIMNVFGTQVFITHFSKIQA